MMRTPTSPHPLYLSPTISSLPTHKRPRSETRQEITEICSLRLLLTRATRQTCGKSASPICATGTMVVISETLTWCSGRSQRANRFVGVGWKNNGFPSMIVFDCKPNLILDVKQRSYLFAHPPILSLYFFFIFFEYPTNFSRNSLHISGKQVH